MNNYTPPEFKKQAFHCPLCNTYSRMSWNSKDYQVYYIAVCDCCNEYSLWRVTRVDFIDLSNYGAVAGEMLYPNFGIAPLPEPDMPENIKQDYEEAARIFSKSPRGAAALLRLGLQKLCVHLGEKGKNINEDIRSLVTKGILAGMVVKVADTVRITGNNAVHPGEISDEDFDMVSIKLFDLINFIVKKAITEPKELDELYKKMPEKARKAAEERDTKQR